MVLTLSDDAQMCENVVRLGYLWYHNLTESVLGWDILTRTVLMHWSEQVLTDMWRPTKKAAAYHQVFRSLRSRSGVLWAFAACNCYSCIPTGLLFVMSSWLPEQAMCKSVFECVWSKLQDEMNEYRNAVLCLSRSWGLWILLRFAKNKFQKKEEAHSVC